MYRHEAVEIARKMMELHGVTDELKPWVIDVVLKVANSAVWEVPLAPDAPPARTPVAWRRAWINRPFADATFEYTATPPDSDSHGWQPLYAE